MLTSVKLTTTDSVCFSRLDTLYTQAFPVHEQRDFASKQRALCDERYALEAWFDGEQFVGLSGLWCFNEYSYIEHLAIDGALRAQGYGKRLLGQLLDSHPLIILEIDPLTTDIAHKRLRFYQSMGFVANPWSHQHPAYHAGMAAHSLIVLSSPRAIDMPLYQRFSDDLRDVVMAGI